MTRTVYGDVVDTWLKYGKNYQTVLFAPDVETSKKYAKLLQQRGILMKEKLEDLQYDGCLTPLLCFLILFLVVGIGTGFFERVLGVSGESDKVVETVTYRKENKVHPIYISIEGFLPEDSQGLGFLLKELDSDLPSYNKYTQGGIVVTLKRGYESSTNNNLLPRTDIKYLFLYNTETNTLCLSQ